MLNSHTIELEICTRHILINRQSNTGPFPFLCNTHHVFRTASSHQIFISFKKYTCLGSCCSRICSSLTILKYVSTRNKKIKKKARNK